MKEEDKISEYGYSLIFFFLMKSTFIGMGYYLILKVSKQDIYISSVLGMILGLFTFFILDIIRKNKYKLNILELNKKIFGSFIGGILNTVISVSFSILGSILLYNYILFVESYYIQETSYIYILFIIIIPILYLSKKELPVITRVTQVLFIISTFIYIFAILGMISNINIANIFPVLEIGNSNLFNGAIMFAIFSTAPILLLTIVPKQKVKGKKSLIAYIFSSFSIILIEVFIILTLGKSVAGLYRNPEYFIMKKISFFDIIEKIENSIAIIYIFDFFIAISMIIYFVKKYVQNIFKDVKMKKYSSEITVGIVTFSSVFIFRNSIFAMELYKNYLMYFLSISLILPMTITAIATKIKESV